MSSNIKDKVLELKNKGYSYKAISKKLGIPISTAKTYLRRENISINFKCKFCGADLVNVPGKKAKKFCNDKCRMAWWNSHQDSVNRKAYYNLTCKHCGKEFESYGNKNRKYCSRECYLAAR